MSETFEEQKKREKAVCLLAVKEVFSEFAAISNQEELDAWLEGDDIEALVDEQLAATNARADKAEAEAARYRAALEDINTVNANTTYLPSHALVTMSEADFDTICAITKAALDAAKDGSDE